MTMQSELVPRDDQPLVNARRTQKVYADVLGRNYKTGLGSDLQYCNLQSLEEIAILQV